MDKTKSSSTTVAAPAESGAQPHAAPIAMEGELHCGEARWPLGGRTLRLILWLVTHQARINATAAENGQLWLTWKGENTQSISGDIRTRL